MTTTQQPNHAADRVARIATEALAPWVWVLGLPLAVAGEATRHPGETVLWGLIVGITGSVIPMIVIVRGARKGRWDGHHVTNREGRAIPLAVCTASLLTGAACLTLGNAPSQMTALALAMLATLIVALAITFGLRWKVSLHAAVSAGAAVILTATYGPWLTLTALPVVIVCWSRVRLGDHTTNQVLVGALVGTIFGGALYITTMNLF